MKSYKIAEYYCTSFGLGYKTKFPGTLASFATLFPVWIIKEYFTSDILLLIIFVYAFFSYLSIKIITNKKKDKDPQFIITDEHLGQAISLLFCEQKILDFLIAFIMFRFLDISKPFPINYFDRINSPAGVLLDDIVAGIITCLLFLIFYEN